MAKKQNVESAEVKETVAVENGEAGSGRVSLVVRMPKQETQEIEFEGGVKVAVKNFIPHEEKLALVQKIAARTLILDDDVGQGYVCIDNRQEAMLTAIEAYTNMDVPIEGRYDLYAYLLKSGKLAEMMQVMQEDLTIVLDMADVLVKSSIDQFNYSKSIEYAINEISSGSSMGQDLLASIQRAADETAAVNRVMSEAVVQPNENIISFSKRKK